MRKFTYVIGEDFEGKAASAFLRHKGYSADIIKDLKKGGLLLNGKAVYTVETMHRNDILETVFPDEETDLEPVKIAGVRLLYSDEDIAVFDKPPYVPTHQSIGHRRDTLANHFASLFPNTRFRAVTRLDKNTSGLCLAALNKLSSSILCENKPKKLYYAAVKGNIPDSGTVNLPIDREREGIIKRTVSENGKPAVTSYKTVRKSEREGGENKLLEITLKTGRTHQIRVHMSHIGYPLLGDELYGGDLGEISRQALHCGHIRFLHPVTGEEMYFDSPIPEDMERLF